MTPAPTHAVNTPARKPPAAPIAELDIPQSTFAAFPGFANNEPLRSLSTLNVFIGPNNSGKSRFLRGLFQTARRQFLPASRGEYAKLVENAKAKARDLRKYYNMSVDRTVHQRTESLSAFDKVQEGEDYLKPLRELIQSLRDWKSPPVLRYGAQGPQADESLPHLDLADYLKLELEALEAKSPSPCEFLPLYVPSLRGLRPLADKHHNFYRDRTKKDYFQQDNNIQAERQHYHLPAMKTPDIYTGLEMYDLLSGFLLGDLHEREKVADFQHYLAKNFFDQEVALIPRQHQDVIFVKVGNEQEQPIHQLGDGIQQIILLTLPMFLFNDRHLLLFIEEPELFLHPGLQRKLIDAMLNTPGAARQVFVATHSNHFLDITLDESRISVYRCSKMPLDAGRAVVPTFQVEVLSSDKERLLVDLGVRNSSVMLANCTIWVEGITDRLYLRRYIEISQRATGTKYCENVHFAFVEYGGACITHWSFLDEGSSVPMNVERICSCLFLVADRGKRKEQRHEQLETKLGQRYYPLKCLEIENLLTPGVIRRVVRDYERGVPDFKQFDQDDYASDPLGRFIDEHVLVDKASSKRLTQDGRRAYAADESGAVKDKLGFAQRAIAYIDGSDDVSDEAKDLASRLLAFIKLNNPDLPSPVSVPAESLAPASVPPLASSPLDATARQLGTPSP